MKRIFTFLVSLCVVSFAMAQDAPSAVFKQASVAPKIDGVIDDVWAVSNLYSIERALPGAELPTVGAPGETTWKGLWTAEGVYILLQVTDDAFYPAYSIPSDATWEYDKPEIYFDVNPELQDAIGAHQGLGHYQFSPGFTKDKIDGTLITDKSGYTHADMVDGSNYIAEYFIPFSLLLDKDGTEVDLTATIGFDVTIIDRDPGDAGRRNALWANTSSAGAWDNMDASGTVKFDGAQAPIDIITLAITGGAEITTDNGTTQFSSAFTPEDATQKYKWVLTNETGMATISPTGIVTAQRNGTVTVKAVSSDQLVSSNELTITISNQLISEADISMIKNGNFDQGADKKENWGGPGVVDDEGFYSVVCVPKAEKSEIWDTMFGQKVKVADATTKYIVKFKAKASADMIIPVLFEDRGTGYNNDKVVTSLSPFRAETMWMVPVTGTEAWYTFDVTFSAIRELSDYELNFQLGKNDGTFSIDNVMMYTEADFELVNSTSSKTIASNQLSVYPNPVGNATELIVNMTESNVKVAIYNAIGQKMMEKVSTGNVAKFNVSSLQKGMYIVRLSDGTTQKFVK